jgi:uncharacterized protein (TIGR00255 family)
MNSMTAFARSQKTLSCAELSWELKSVNHRFLDVFFRLPENLRFLEPELRKVLGKKLTRGRVEVSLQVKFHAMQSFEQLNHQLIDSLVETASKLADKHQIPNDFGVKACLSWPSAWQQSENQVTLVAEEALNAFENAVDALIQMRAQEGQAISGLIEERRQKLLNHLQEIIRIQALYPSQLRDKLQAKIALLTDISFDRQRLEQELALILIRTDIAEEIDRLQTHLYELGKVLSQKEALGRRLDFLIQEFHRETNTIGSKTDDSQVSQHIIEMKVLIEQMREQIQNVE